MTRLKACLAALAILAAWPAYAAERHTITDSYGDTIVLENGDTYTSDDPAMETWTEGSTVIVPSGEDKLVNPDTGEAVDAEKE